jgi:ribosome biogenesis protein Tsr3
MKPIWIIRHHTEPRKKCSLTPLEKRKDLKFYSDRDILKLNFNNTIILHPEGTRLTKRDKDKQIVLIDSYWKKAFSMYNRIIINQKANVKLRSINGWETAYARKSKFRSEPKNGLASAECLFALNLIFGKYNKSLLKGYYWKDKFLEKNKKIINRLRK